MLDAADVHHSDLPFGETPDFIRSELIRVGARAAEVRSALDFVARPVDLRAYDALTPRMRRLVDLVAVAGDRVLGAARPASVSNPAEV